MKRLIITLLYKCINKNIFGIKKMFLEIKIKFSFNVLKLNQNINFLFKNK
jgi:hypothetical protein